MSLFLHKKVEAAMAHPNIYYRTYFLLVRQSIVFVFKRLFSFTTTVFRVDFVTFFYKLIFFINQTKVLAF